MRLALAILAVAVGSATEPDAVMRGPDVADDDRVVGEPGEQLAVDPGGVHGVGLRGEQRCVALGRGLHLLAQARGPVGPVGAGSPALHRFSYAVESLSEVARHRSGQGQVRRDLRRRVGQVDHLGQGRSVLAAEEPVAEPEVQRGADDDDQVGAAQRGRACLGDEQRVPAGDDSSTLAVGQRGHAEALDEAQRGLLGAVEPHVGAQDE